jgi:predicted nucleic acid-binding protein
VDRLFLDANVLFSAAYRSESRLRALWSLTGVELYTSQFALEEARHNLVRYAPQTQTILRLATLVAKMTLLTTVPTSVTLPRWIALPKKDLPILLAAIAADCTHLLTGDKRHFEALYGKTVGSVLILTPAQYFRTLPYRGFDA